MSTVIEARAACDSLVLRIGNSTVGLSLPSGKAVLTSVVKNFDSISFLSARAAACLSSLCFLSYSSSIRMSLLIVRMGPMLDFLTAL